MRAANHSVGVADFGKCIESGGEVLEDGEGGFGGGDLAVVVGDLVGSAPGR